MTTQTLIWTGQTAAASATSSPYSSTCVVEKQSGQTVYARTDGQVAVIQAAGTVEVANGATVVLTNEQPLPNASTRPDEDVTGLPGWTAEQGFTNSSLYPVVSLIPRVRQRAR